VVQRKITEIDRAVILSGVSTGTSVPISQIFLGIPLHFSKTMIAFRGRGQPGLSHALVPALGVQEVVVWTAFTSVCRASPALLSAGSSSV